MKKISLGIGLFAFNRPSHLKRVLISLENYKINNLTVFIDGPKNNNDSIIQENILFMLKNSKIKNIKIIKQFKNLGLSKSLIYGINYLSNKYDKFIILEDDCIPYKNFFKFFEVCFEKYENDPTINSICSYQFPELVDKNQKTLKLIILDHFIPWGWGTWSHKWKKYSSTKINSFKNFPKFMSRFNSTAYRKKKKKDIWTLNYILYQYTFSLKSIFPNISLIKNIGFDGSGVNSKFSSNFLTKEHPIKYFDEKLEQSSIRTRNSQKRILANKIELFF